MVNFSHNALRLTLFLQPNSVCVRFCNHLFIAEKSHERTKLNLVKNIFAYANTSNQTQVRVVDMAPGCRTVFMLMSTDRECSFWKYSAFSTGIMSAPHVTVSQLKEMITLFPSILPLGPFVCVHGQTCSDVCSVAFEDASVTFQMFYGQI